MSMNVTLDDLAHWLRASVGFLISILRRSVRQFGNDYTYVGFRPALEHCGRRSRGSGEDGGKNRVCLRVPVEVKKAPGEQFGLDEL